MLKGFLVIDHDRLEGMWKRKPVKQYV